MYSIEPLTEEVIRAAVRENARIRAVQSGPTVPYLQAIANYSRVSSILVALAIGGPEQALALYRAQPGAVTNDDIAAVERQREEILSADSKLALMVSRIEARRRSKAEAGPLPRRRARRAKSPSELPEATPEAPSATHPVIGYVTPKGKPYMFGKKTIAHVWERVERFLRECTDADPLRPASPTLMFAETTPALQLAGVAAALERARALLGPSNPMPWLGLGVLHPELTAASVDPLITGGVQHQWDVPADRVDVAIHLMLAGDPWPQTLMPIASLSLLYRFHWTGTGRDGATESSTCFLHLASSSTLIPTFLFPFESADDGFLAYLERIKKLVPLPLSARNFRLFQPTSKSGTLVPRLFDTSAIATVLKR